MRFKICQFLFAGAQVGRKPRPKRHTQPDPGVGRNQVSTRCFLIF